MELKISHGLILFGGQAQGPGNDFFTGGAEII